MDSIQTKIEAIKADKIILKQLVLRRVLFVILRLEKVELLLQINIRCLRLK